MPAGANSSHYVDIGYPPERGLAGRRLSVGPGARRRRRPVIHLVIAVPERATRGRRLRSQPTAPGVPR